MAQPCRSHFYPLQSISVFLFTQFSSQTTKLRLNEVGHFTDPFNYTSLFGTKFGSGRLGWGAALIDMAISIWKISANHNIFG
jgi:hypothetical protein